MPNWAGSDRRDHLPPNWAALRKACFRRDGHRCTALDPNDGTRCPEPATDCDHLGERTDHRLHMLTSLCSWHHNKKSSEQGGEARAKQRARNHHKFRRSEKHPGLI